MRGMNRQPDAGQAAAGRDILETGSIAAGTFALQSACFIVPNILDRMHKNKCIKTQIKVDLKADIKQHGLYGHAVFAFLGAESPQSVRFAAFRISGYPGIMHSGFRHAGIAFRAGLHGFFYLAKARRAFRRISK